MGSCCSAEVRKYRTRITMLEGELARLRAPWKALDDADHVLARQYECKICFDQPIDTVFLPCGHAMACFSCASRLKREGEARACPVCASEIEQDTRLVLL